MAANFPQPPNSSLFKHHPDLVHGKEVPIQSASKVLRTITVKSFGSRANSLAMRRECGLSSIVSFSHLYELLNNDQTTTALNPAIDPWRLIRNKSFGCRPRVIRLIVHGSSDGRPHPLIKSIAMGLENIRGVPVEIEVLTSKKSMESSSDSIWLVPLLLLPGSHTRKDVPLIASRLRTQGVNVGILPFLGALKSWLYILRHLIQIEFQDEPICFTHHPVKNHLFNRYTDYLSKELNAPVIPINDWDSFNSAHKLCFSPIPLFLSPNKISSCLENYGKYSALLEWKLVRNDLISLLGLLP